jgi:HrpA-like RNA helicase
LYVNDNLIQAMNVDPFNFEWLEPPDRVALEIAMEELLLLGALDHRHYLTGLGTLISELQIDPGIARMLHYACSKGLGKNICMFLFNCNIHYY